MNERLHVLDGLRGWAAMVVTILHIFYQILPPPGVFSLSLDAWWPFTGKFSVAIFFLVSGFSLSVAFLRTGDKGNVYRMLAGRYLRLAIPVMAACAVMSLFMNAGAILSPAERPTHLAGFFDFVPTLAHLVEFGVFGVFFDYSVQNSYAPPLWTISYELFGSILVACLLLALGQPARRGPVYAAVALVFFVYQPWYFLFVAGVIFAGMHNVWSRHMSLRAGVCLMGLGAVLSGVSGEQPHLLAFSATLFFAGAIHTSGAVRFFSNRVSRWLGEISFPIYLLHIPITFAAGLPLYVQGPADMATALFAGLVALAASIVAAVLFIPVNTWAMRVARRFGRAVTAPRARPA